MRILHTSDLHLGIQVHGFSLHEDQVFILQQICDIAQKKEVDAVLISGDIYDKSAPSGQAVQLFDDFLTDLVNKGLTVFVSAGNHDSSERLSYAGRLLSAQGLYISPVYSGEEKAIVLEDEHGPVNFYLLPFIKPTHVRQIFPEVDINSYSDAVAQAIDVMAIDETERNVLLAHQFVAGSIRSDSERISIGGSDNVEAALMHAFDYVALGHIHRPQKTSYNHILYAGSPLKYSVSEAGHQKSVSLVDLHKKGELKMERYSLEPLRDLRVIKGSYDEIVYKPNYENTNREDFVKITLTDEEEVPEALGKLRVIYPNILQLTYDNLRSRINQSLPLLSEMDQESPAELFADFYENQNNQPLSVQQEEYIDKLIDKFWGTKT